MNELSKAYAEAVGVHNNILAHAQIAQQSIFEMGTGIKKMRDGKLYKELGYSNFEEYCEQALEIKKTQAYKYIAIVERLGENVHSSGQNISINKLYLLSTLSESDRQELTERVDVEDISTRKLKEEIDRLRAENSQLSDANGELTQACQEVCEAREKAEREKKSLERQVKELEARPIEVIAKDVDVEKEISEALRAAEQKHSEELEQLKQKHDKQMGEMDQVIKSLNAELDEIEDNDQSEELRALEAAKEKAEADMKAAEEKHQAEMETLHKQYEDRLNSVSGGDNKAIFKVHYRTVYNAFNSMMVFIKSVPAEEKNVLLEKVEDLLAAVEKAMQEV